MTSGRISIAGELGSFGEFSAMMTELELSDMYEDIEIQICSGGGELGTGLAIAGRIMDSEKHTTSVGFGGVQSMAVLPFIVANHRCLHHMGFIMLHNSLVQVAEYEPLPLVEAYLEHIKVLDNNFFEYLGEHTRKPASYWKKRIEGGKEHYIYPEEAVKLGLCEEIL